MAFSAFEYTLIADLREAFSEVDEQQPLAYGELLFNTRSCAGCHSIEKGVADLGPSLFGIAERASEAYIRESIVSPNAVITKGFAADIMPGFEGVLDNSQIDALVAYLGSLK
ncbi:MAG: cytochrome c family protein [Flavobacteriaceae bacterium]